MSKQVSQKYLDALRTINNWTIVSDWAIKVGEMYPEILAKADKEAANQKNETTGLREIAARISSNISRGAYAGQIEIDESERPRRVRYITESEAESQIQHEIEEDVEPLTRAQRIRADEDSLSVKDRYRLDEFQNIIEQLRKFFNLDFELEHAKALLNHADPGKHHPDNIQLLLKSHNRMKSNSNWDRFTLEEQIAYIKATIEVQTLVSKKMQIELEPNVIDQIIERLKNVY